MSMSSIKFCLVANSKKIQKKYSYLTIKGIRNVPATYLPSKLYNHSFIFVQPTFYPVNKIHIQLDQQSSGP